MATLKDLSEVELSSTADDVKQRWRQAIRAGLDADEVAALEATMTRVYNELRRRGL